MSPKPALEGVGGGHPSHCPLRSTRILPAQPVAATGLYPPPPQPLVPTSSTGFTGVCRSPASEPNLCLRVVRLDWGGGGGVGGWVRGLWVGGLVWFWAIWPNVPTPPQGGGWGLGGWVGNWVGAG